jgi:hypothetical protein
MSILCKKKLLGYVKRISFAKAIFIFLIACLTTNGFAQVLSQTIRGVVTDIENKKAIEGATICVLNSEPLLQTSTDQHGGFRFDSVPVGRYTLKISSVGYEEKMISNWLIKTGKEAVLNIELQSAVINLKVLEVTKKSTSANEMLTVSGRTFSVDETKRYPASINDPSRMVMSYPGVTSGYDRDNQIIIRGNAPKGLLWMLEGIEVPSPNHFSTVGASSGAVSMLSATMLGNSDFITGAFPAEYGNATSGVFDIKLRNGNNEKREYTFQAGFLGLEAGAEGPFIKDKGASYLVNYRYSSTSFFNLAGYKVQGNAIPAFQDASFKFFFPTKKAGTFSLYGLGGLSTISQKLDNKQESFDYQLGVVGLSHQYRINDNNYMRSVVSVSDKVISFRSFQKFSWFDKKYKGDFTDDALGFSIQLTSKLNAKNSLKTGISYQRLLYDYYSANDYSYKPISDVYMDDDGKTNYTHAFASWKYRINSKIAWVNGVHFLKLDLNNHYAIEPRSAIKWQLTTTQSLSAGFGVHSRMEPFQTYLDRSSRDSISRNKHLDFTKANHYVLGYDKIITEDLSLRAEVYYQQLYNVPIAPDSAIKFSTLNFGSNYYSGKLVNEGTGRNYGIELTIDKKISKGYFFLVTASLFESKYKAADKVERNTFYNSNYVSNYIVGKEFWLGKKRRNLLNTSIRVNWTGGKRYTPIDLKRSISAGDEILERQKAFSEKMDDYFRIDLQIGYIHNHSKFNSELRLDIQNITNRKNIFELYYDPVKEEIRESYQLGFIPCLSYKIEF